MSVDREALWLDDIRRPPSPFWIWARTIDDAKLVVNNNNIMEASLDHDMGLEGYDPDEQDADLRRVPHRFRCYEHCGAITYEKGLNIPPDECVGCGSTTLSKIDEPDGVEFAKWLVKEDKVPTLVVLHSMNPVGAENMRKILDGHAKILIVKSFQRY